MVTRDWVGIIFYRHESIKAAIQCCHGQWKHSRAFHMYYIRHIAANFLYRFKKPYLYQLVVSIDNSQFNYLCLWMQFFFIFIIHWPHYDLQAIQGWSMNLIFTISGCSSMVRYIQIGLTKFQEKSMFKPLTEDISMGIWPQTWSSA